jgi:hypothetical protein
MIRDKGIIGIFRQNEHLAHFDSLMGHFRTLEN